MIPLAFRLEGDFGAGPADLVFGLCLPRKIYFFIGDRRLCAVAIIGEKAREYAGSCERLVARKETRSRNPAGTSGSRRRVRALRLLAERLAGSPVNGQDEEAAVSEAMRSVRTNYRQVVEGRPRNDGSPGSKSCTRLQMTRSTNTRNSCKGFRRW